MYTLIEIALSVGVLITLASVLSLCVCGCKNSNQKTHSSVDTPSMNGTEFLRFMNEPNSQDCILEEYNSINSMQKKETRHGSEQTELEIKGCLPLARYFSRYPKLTNHEAILGASFINSYNTKRKFLCTSNPRKEDCEKFWQAVWDHKVQIIVMMCRLTEKSFQYWSPKEGCVLVYNKLEIKTFKIKVLSHCTITLLSLNNHPERRRSIFHCQYTAWPRDKFPHQPDAFIDFYRCIDDMNNKLVKRVANNEFNPILVHCIDGVGSSDVFCVFDACVTQFEATGILSLPNVIKKMRRQKHGVINRPDYYVLCYQLVKAYLEENLSIGSYMASAQNSQRSLPEIPQPVGRHDSGDTASEIYATLNLDVGNKAAPEASTSRDHPYEHAYAKLQNENHNVVVEITPDQKEDEIPIDERDASQSGPESVVISASVAISGALPSSHELPYITPPSPRPQHFSGDSTDSAKGYTSISVREPLSNIRAQSAAQPPAQPHYATVSDDSDEMYAAIEEAHLGSGSDTYAQIAPEPRRRSARPPPPDHDHQARRSAPPEIGASTSNATHSRQASSSSCSNSTGALGSPKPEKRQANSPLPPPPLAHPAHTTHTTHTAHAAHTSHAPHAAHASHDARSHQRISSTGDLFNNDKLRRSLNEKHQRNNSCVSSSDFYGCNYPVDKHRFSSGDLIRPLVAKELHVDIDRREEPERAADSPQRNLDDMYAKVVKKAKGKILEEPLGKPKRAPGGEGEPRASEYRADDPGYETIDRKKSNHGYETVARKERKTSRNQDPGYETVKDVNESAPHDDSLGRPNRVSDGGPDSIVSGDAGYERISKVDNGASDSDPNYEVLRDQPPTPPYATIAPDFRLQPTYSTVDKRPGKYRDWPDNNGDLLESNYESMPHDPLYKGSGSESDPNYESVRPKDPNYESVNARDPNYESLRLDDPKYESVRSKVSKNDSQRSKKDPNYESVKYFELSKKEPPYEKLNNEAASASVERSDSAAGYERIAPARLNGADLVGDYFQV